MEPKVAITILNLWVQFFDRKVALHVYVVVYTPLRVIVFYQQVLLSDALLPHLGNDEIGQVTRVFEKQSGQSRKLFLILQNLTNEKTSKRLLSLFLNDCLGTSVIGMLEVAKMEYLKLRHVPREHSECLFAQVRVATEVKLLKVW